MDAATQAVILDKHNKHRNTLAGGKIVNEDTETVVNFATAAAMPEMTWDAELASIAVKNAMQCVFAHDQCRNTKSYLYAGQNIGSAYGGKYRDSKACAKKIIDKWFSEYENPALTQSFLDNYQKR